MPDREWEPPWHRHQEPSCDCELRRALVTVTITDAAGNVRAVREAEFSVRPHRHHHGRHERGEGM